MAKIITDIPDDEYNYFMNAEGLDLDDGWDAIEYICNGKVISDNATNGDVLKAMFPKAECKREQDVVYFDINIKGDVWFSSLFDIAWWNAPYKADREAEE